MSRYSLKATLLLAISMTVLSSIVLVTFLASQRYSSSLEEHLQAQALNLGSTLENEVTDLVLINDLVGLQKRLQSFQKSTPSMSYAFVLKKKRILASTFQEGVPQGLLGANSPKPEGKRSFQAIVSEQGQRYLDLALPLFQGKAGTLRLGFSEAPLMAKVKALWQEVALAALVILLLAIMAGLYWINRLTRPLEELVQAIEEMDPQQQDMRLHIRGQPEVQALARAFNSMAERIQDYTGRVRLQTDQLQKAHKQMRTSCEIARGVSGLGTLQEVGGYLLQRLRGMLHCDEILLLVLSSSGKRIFMVSYNGVQEVPGEEPAYRLEELLQEVQSFALPGEISIPKPLVPERCADQGHSVLPIYHEDVLCGAMVGICTQGGCRQEEMELVSLVLANSSGSLRRAVLHQEELSRLMDQVQPGPGFKGLIGRDARMQSVYQLIQDVAPTEATVLIQGESGTGKELVARAIHEQSLRRDTPFVVVNCSAYPTTLLESELFGHEKGAFTGAIKQRQGRFEQAHGGTVFLDEIGEIEPSAQVKLLRFLQDQRLERLGSGKGIQVDVRVLAATNTDLEQKIDSGDFREDLFYRLNVVAIELPPLRERGNDIAILARHFLQHYAREQNKQITEITSRALRALLEYDWPGNVRELENVIEQAVVLGKGSRIGLEDLPRHVQNSKKGSAGSRTLQDQEQSILLQTLKECDWNKKLAAQRLGIGRSTLYAKLKKFGISTEAAQQGQD